MAEYMETDKITDKLDDILAVLNVIARLLRQLSPSDVEKVDEQQREKLLREMLRDEVQKRCQEGHVLQMQDLLKNYNASCVSEVKAEELVSVLTVVATYQK